MNLTKTAEAARKIIVLGIALIAIILVTKTMIIPMGKAMYKALVPDKDPPTPIYGKLEAPVFTQKRILNSEPKYKLDTKTGRLPTNFPNKMPVYRVEISPFSYEAGKKASSTAEFLGFSDFDLVSDLKGDIYKWRNISTGRDLEIEINSKNLMLTTNMSGKGGLYTAGVLNNEAVVKNEAINFLVRTERFNDNLYKEGTQKVVYGKLSGQRIVETENPMEAQFARIDFFRSIYKVPIYGPDPSSGLLSVVVGNSRTPNLKYVSATTKMAEINTITNATYPIVPIKQVWDAIQKNNGAIASVGPDTQSAFEPYSPVRVENVLISEIELVYFESEETQRYLQPVYLFRGFYTSGNSKGSIALYYPAIASEYILETPEEE